MIWKEKDVNIGTDPNVTYEDGVITLGAESINGLLDDASNFPVTLVITFDDTAAYRGGGYIDKISGIKKQKMM